MPSRTTPYPGSTKEQKETLEEFLVEGEAMIRKLFAMGLRAQRSVVPLPHTNEEGTPVVHGCNMRVRHLRDSCHDAITMLNWQGSFDHLFRDPGTELYDQWIALKNKG